MDLTLLVGVAISLLIVIITVFLFRKKSKSDDESKVPTEGSSVDSSGNLRRAQIARNQRNRLRNGPPVSRTTPATNENIDDHSAAAATSAALSDEKLGAKKRAKLEAKAEKRIQREAELKTREDRKLQENILEEERRKTEEKEAEEERKQEEIERLEREERERKELEEYLKMKEAFSVEEEGFEEGDDSEKENLLADFIQYIKNNKVVILEDLAIQFKLKTQQAIDRITELQANGTLTGVIDDRGKFIYISEDELKAVANFIRQRGRVSITELAESSNALINLTPVE